MSTVRLYWDDAYRVGFTARIIERLVVNGHPAVLLDQTCFYPTSGGQPHDVGTLGEVSVIDVRDEDRGVVHVLSGPLQDAEVRGQIAWSRRLDHMQQHTGQHILSQAFERQSGAETVSFHLGEEVCTIDLAVLDLGDQQAAAAESLAHDVVLADGPVTTRVYAPDELSSLALRRPPKAQDSVRVVSVSDFDVCACGGTHVTTTGQVGPIHIRRWTKQRGNTRVEFLCGLRALRDYCTKDRICYALAGDLSTGVEDLLDAVARLRESERSAQHGADALRARVLELELPGLVDQAEQMGDLRVLCRRLEGYDAGNMRYIAQQVVLQPHRVALLGVTDPSPQLCFARSEDVDLDMARLLRDVTQHYGGKGGGRPHVAQGGGIRAADMDALLAEARQRVRDH